MLLITNKHYKLRLFFLFNVHLHIIIIHIHYHIYMSTRIINDNILLQYEVKII